MASDIQHTVFEVRKNEKHKENLLKEVPEVCINEGTVPTRERGTTLPDPVPKHNIPRMAKWRVSWWHIYRLYIPVRAGFVSQTPWYMVHEGGISIKVTDGGGLMAWLLQARIDTRHTYTHIRTQQGIHLMRTPCTNTHARAHTHASLSFLYIIPTPFVYGYDATLVYQIHNTVFHMKVLEFF